LRQDPGHAAESPAEAATCGHGSANADVRVEFRKIMVAGDLGSERMP